MMDLREGVHYEECPHCGGSFGGDLASTMLAAQLCRIGDVLEDELAGGACDHTSSRFHPVEEAEDQAAMKEPKL